MLSVFVVYIDIEAGMKSRLILPVPITMNVFCRFKFALLGIKLLSTVKAFRLFIFLDQLPRRTDSSQEFE